MGGPYSTHQRNEKYIFSVGKPEGKRSLGISRPRPEDKLKWVTVLKKQGVMMTGLI
jgi:hypothetical protein